MKVKTVKFIHKTKDFVVFFEGLYKKRKDIIKNWNGYDYYDGEYIKDNFNLNHNDSCYPTLDHKISVLYGFKNEISVDEICNIDNICITKRKTNSQKSSKNEEEYKK